MSWEEINNKRLKCPCNLDTYTIKYFMDDWSRSRESWEMNCKNCNKIYELYIYYYYDSGKEWPANIWVKKEDYKRFIQLERELKNKQKSLVSFAKHLYLKK